MQPENANPEELAKILRDENPTIWVGAGGSVAAGYPDTRTLIERILKNDPRLRVLAENREVTEFYDVISKAVAGNGARAVHGWLDRIIPQSGTPVEFHNSLSRLCKAGKINRILTTNFDTLIEDSLRLNGVPHNLQILDGNIELRRHNPTLTVIKLHGSVDDWYRVILSAESFDGYAAEHPELLAQLKDLLKTSWLICFGCSMKDRRILELLSVLSKQEKQNLPPWLCILSRESFDELKNSTFRGRSLPELFEDTYTRWLVVPSHADAHDLWNNASEKAAFKYELLVLYRWGGEEHRWVEHSLVPALTAAGIRPVLARDTFVAGRRKADETARVIECSRTTLWVLSAGSVAGNDVVLHDGLVWKFSAQSPFAGIPFTLSKDLTLPAPIRDAVPLSWADPKEHANMWRKLLTQLNAPKLDAPPPSTVEVRGASTLDRHSQEGANYVLLSTQSIFTEQLGRLLMEDDRLGLGYCYSEAPKNFDDYLSSVRAFLKDKSESSKWLFTVQPEDAWSPRLSNSLEREILDRLADTGKKIVFFESGGRFLEYGPAPKRNNIFLIRTKYAVAVRQMIAWAVEHHLAPGARLPDRSSIHIVMMHGPSSPAANERRRVYTEFCSCLQFDQGLIGTEPPRSLEWEGLYSPLCNFDVHVTSIIQDSWLRDEARRATLRHGSRLGVDSNERICFFCGNDDMALGAVDAMHDLKADDALRTGRIAFCGFDGLGEFPWKVRQPGNEGGFRGATAKVNLLKMREIAAELVKTAGNSPGTGDISIDAEIIRTPLS